MANEAGWTFDTLKKYVDERLRGMDLAVSKAEVQLSHRFDAVNEFRGALTDLSNRMLPRQEYDIQHKALTDRIAVQEDRIAALQLSVTELVAQNATKKQNVGTMATYAAVMVMAVSALTAVVTLIITHTK